MKLKLDEKIIRSMVPADYLKDGQERVVIWDDSQKGLGLTVHRSWTFTWVLRYSIHGRPGKVTLGNWPDVPYSAAKGKAQKLRGNIADGVDPSRVKDAVTVRDLLARLREDYYPSLSPSTVRTYDMLWDRHILPMLGRLLVGEVALADAARLHHKLKAKPRTANQALAVLSKALNMAETWGFREPNTNPCTAIQRFREEKRERYLTTGELVELGNRLRDMGPRCRGELIRTHRQSRGYRPWCSSPVESYILHHRFGFGLLGLGSRYWAPVALPGVHAVSVGQIRTTRPESPEGGGKLRPDHLIGAFPGPTREGSPRGGVALWLVKLAVFAGHNPPSGRRAVSPVNSCVQCFTCDVMPRVQNVPHELVFWAAGVDVGGDGLQGLPVADQITCTLTGGSYRTHNGTSAEVATGHGSSCPSDGSSSLSM